MFACRSRDFAARAESTDKVARPRLSAYHPLQVGSDLSNSKSWLAPLWSPSTFLQNLQRFKEGTTSAPPDRVS